MVDHLPAFEQDVEVADEIACLLTFASGAHDDAHAFGQGEVTQDTLEAGALFFILNLAGNSQCAGVGHEH